MTKDAIKQEVIEMVRVILPDEDFNEINETASFKEQYGIDSMDLLDIAMEIRKKFKITIPETELKELATLQGCANYIYQKLNP